MGSNIIDTTTIYSGVSELGDEWIVDAFIQFSENIPSATIAIIDPALGGTPVTLTNVLANSKIWLSDLIFSQLSAAPKRTKLNTHITQVFNADVQGLIATGDLTFTVVASNLANLEGTRQGTFPLSESDYVVLATDTIQNASFSQ